MTKDGEQWAIENLCSKDHCNPDCAEHFLCAFFSEVETRAYQLALTNGHGIPHDPNFVDISEAFNDLKCRLLGDCGHEQLGCRCDLPKGHVGLHEGKDSPMCRRVSWRTNEVALWVREAIQRIVNKLR